MTMDPMDLFDRGSAWTKTKIAGAKGKLDAATPCEEWNVRALINHVLSGHEIFQGAAKGQPVAPPEGDPPDVMADDPVAQYEDARQATITAYREPGAIEKAGSTLGIAFVDNLVHGHDLAKATGQDTTMPPDLAEAAFGMISGRLDAGRGTFFKPAVDVSDGASTQDKLLAYMGRKP
jgi:uncharacterized protein (TIGR03086 family)